MRVVKNLFDSKSSRVIRVLLNNPDKKWTIRGISKESHIALGYTHAIVETLMRQNYLARDESYKIALIDPIRLLRRWAASYDYFAQNTILNFHSFEQEIDRFYASLSNVKINYALTGLAGAWLIAPHVRPVTIDIYVRKKSDVPIISKQLRLEPIEKGGNTRLVLPYDTEVFYGAQKYREINIVSAVQLFVDLYNYPARGAEAADALLAHITRTWGKALTGDRFV